MTDWLQVEVEAVVADYLAMLALEIRGVAFNKAERNRALQTVTGRSHGSIEMKHQNISAALRDRNSPWIDGYKPLPNYQRLLAEVLEAQLNARPELDQLLEAVVLAQQTEKPTAPDLLSIFVPPPERMEKGTRLQETPTLPFRGKRNYLEMEARNASLGRAGEELVLRYEHERLWRAGEKRLAEKIEHVSEKQGDGVGYDILSFETDGRERLIEVKTTRFGALTPFFASRNEVEVSAKFTNIFQLYRVYKFSESPRIFSLPGSLRSSCELEPVTFQAKVA